MYNDYETFKKEVFNLTSINLDKYKERQMKRRIDALIAKHHISSYSEYVELIRTEKEMFDEFVEYLTINVSEFFRNKEQWDILEKSVLPDIIKNSQHKINIWSAACSTGEEPYSLAMLLLEHIPIDHISIIATDLDKQVLDKAQKGLYTSKNVTGVPTKYLYKYFERIDTEYYQIKDILKKCVHFKKHDLLKDIYPHNMDLIVCRNVLIYFTEDAKEGIYHNFHSSLNPGGVLFVGSTEQIISSSKLGYESVKSFFYKKL